MKKSKRPSNPPPPFVCFVGRSNSGKTTLLTKLIPKFKAMGITIGTIKNTHHDVEFDKPGKDSWQYSQAGSDRVLVSSGKKLAVFSEADTAPPLRQLVADWFQGFDLVISEGFKNEDCFKIEVCRSANDKTPLHLDPAFRIDAVVGDIAPPPEIPFFSFSELDQLISWICQRLDLDCPKS